MSKNGLFYSVVELALNKNKKYHTKNVPFYGKREPFDISALLSHLEYMAGKSGATDSDIRKLSQLSSCDDETLEVVKRIVRKDLRCGADIKLFKDFIIIEEHKIAKAIDDIDKFLSKCSREVCWSLKLDGCRGWAVDNNNSVRWLSSGGHTLPEQYQVFNNGIRAVSYRLNKVFKLEYPIIFDGEISCSDPNFQDVLSNFRRIHGIRPETLRFNVFDLVLKNTPQIERLRMLKQTLGELQTEQLKYVQHPRLLPEQMNKEWLIKKCEELAEDGEEGMVIKDLNAPYSFKRNHFWCKVTLTKTEDVPVVCWLYGEKGKKWEHLLGRLVCIYQGKEFEVGTGFSDQERKDFMNNTPKMIEIKFKGLTKDGIPRHARFNRVRDDKI